MRNRIYNAANPHQGPYKRVLCVCSAGLLRSPTAALALSCKPYNYNTRSCGLDESHALIPLDQVLIAWADEIVCMTREQEDRLRQLVTIGTPIINLNIPDSFAYRDRQLVKLIRKNYNKYLETL